MPTGERWRTGGRDLLRLAFVTSAAAGVLAADRGGRASPEAERAAVTTQPIAPRTPAAWPHRLLVRLTGLEAPAQRFANEFDYVIATNLAPSRWAGRE